MFCESHGKEKTCRIPPKNEGAFHCNAPIATSPEKNWSGTFFPSNYHHQLRYSGIINDTYSLTSVPVEM